MGNRTYSRVFNDQEKLYEMFRLRTEGWSLKKLGNKYGVDHSSIVFQCKKYGVTKTTKIIKMTRNEVIEKIVPVVRAKSPLLEEPMRDGFTYNKYVAIDKRRTKKYVNMDRAKKDVSSPTMFSESW